MLMGSKADTFLQLNQVIIGIIAIGFTWYLWRKSGRDFS